MTGRGIRARAVLLGVVLAMCAAGLAPLGCSSDEDRLRSHLERADEYAEKGEVKEAILELREDGGIRVRIGSMSNGQGHRTAYAQIVHEVFGVPLEDVELVQGDTDAVPSGVGTGGSWSIPMGGGAVELAAVDLAESARAVAADALEVAAGDLMLEDGVFRVAGTDIALPLAEVARRAPGLRAVHRFAPPNYTFPYGAHLAEVEVDPETGQCRILRYLAVHDFGRVLNPLLLAGQVHGGLAQGLGQGLLEQTVFDEEGQLLTGSFADYAIPRADDLPSFELETVYSPAPGNPIDVKGCGEAGAAGSPPAFMNALLDALAPAGVRALEMPATPERIWRALRQSGSDQPDSSN